MLVEGVKRVHEFAWAFGGFFALSGAKICELSGVDNYCPSYLQMEVRLGVDQVSL